MKKDSSTWQPGPTGQLDRVEAVPIYHEGDDLNKDLIFKAHDGTDVNLKKIAESKNVVIFVYPGNGQGINFGELWGCTPESCAYSRRTHEFENADTVVFGLSMQASSDQDKFAQQQHLNFQILSDSEKLFANAFGIPIWRVKDGDRRGEEFPARCTVVIQAGGHIKSIQKDIQIRFGHETDDAESHVSDIKDIVSHKKISSRL